MMAAAGGRDDIRALFRAFRGQARHAGTTTNGPERHPDGWGLAEARSDLIRHVARSPRDGYEDPAFLEAVERLGATGPGAFFLAHFRQASQGDVSLENTHPFIRDGWAFAHNGTIQGLPHSADVDYDGETDSERFFAILLRHIEGASSVEAGIRSAVHEVTARHRFSSLTFLLTNGTTLYAYRRLGDDVDGCGSKECHASNFSLLVARRGTATVIAQEASFLPALADVRAVPDDGLVVWPLGHEASIVSLGAKPRVLGSPRAAA